MLDFLPASFALHHVGVLVKDIGEAAQDFAIGLGYRIESEVIEDPVQTAHVQFLRQPGSISWLELITPNGSESKLSAGVRKGGGLHHLCYEVGDIEAACEHLRSRGMLLLSEPVPAVAFGGRRIAWLMDRFNLLLELVEAGAGPLALASICHKGETA
jgi:methylmalonyl-CoA/ethylmalonyl-CoA epimerase